MFEKDDIYRIMVGLQIFCKNGYKKVECFDGVIYCGDILYSEDEEEMLHNLGWSFNEDRNMWFYLCLRI